MRAICSRPPRPLPPGPNTPWPHEFCWPAFNAHVEFQRRRYRRLRGNPILRARSTLLRRSGLSGRFRVMLAGDGPLSAHPIDFAIQGHFYLRFLKRLPPQARNEDIGALRLRNTERAAGWDKLLELSVFLDH